MVEINELTMSNTLESSNNQNTLSKKEKLKQEKLEKERLEKQKKENEKMLVKEKEKEKSKSSFAGRLFGGSKRPKENKNTDTLKSNNSSIKNDNSKSSSSSASGGVLSKSQTTLQTPQPLNQSKKVQKTSSAVPPKGMIRCLVTYLDETVKTFDMDKSALGSDLMDLICKDLELVEKEYFSLTYRDITNMKLWLEHDKKIKSQLKGYISDEIPAFNFEVKFYPPEPNLLQEEITRYLLTLQLRHDIMDGKLPCSFVTHALLGSYSVQAELGDYDPDEHGQDYSYLEGFFFAPNQTTQLFEAVADYHKDHKGQLPSEAEMHFLENAVKLAMYGVDLHNAKDSDGVDILIGVSATGLMVYRDHLRINRFAWPKILKISYKRNYFYLKLRAGEFEKYESTIGFRCPNHKAAKRLWRIAIEHHSFFRLREPEKPLKNKLLPNFNAGFRYTGSSTYMQTRQRSVDRQQPEFERSLSKRLTQSMDKGLANTTPGSSNFKRNHPNMSTLSIPDKINFRESDEEDEYEVREQPRLPKLDLNNSQENKRQPQIIDATAGAFNPNNSQNTPNRFNLNANRKSNTIQNFPSNNSNDSDTNSNDQYYTGTNRTPNTINKNEFNNSGVGGGGSKSTTPTINRNNQQPRYVPSTSSSVFIDQRGVANDDELNVNKNFNQQTPTFKQKLNQYEDNNAPTSYSGRQLIAQTLIDSGINQQYNDDYYNIVPKLPSNPPPDEVQLQRHQNIINDSHLYERKHSKSSLINYDLQFNDSQQKFIRFNPNNSHLNSMRSSNDGDESYNQLNIKRRQPIQNYSNEQVQQELYNNNNNNRLKNNFYKLIEQDSYHQTDQYGGPRSPLPKQIDNRGLPNIAGASPIIGPKDNELNYYRDSMDNNNRRTGEMTPIPSSSSPIRAHSGRVIPPIPTERNLSRNSDNNNQFQSPKSRDQLRKEEEIRRLEAEEADARRERERLEEEEEADRLYQIKLRQQIEMQQKLREKHEQELRLIKQREQQEQEYKLNRQREIDEEAERLRYEEKLREQQRLESQRIKYQEDLRIKKIQEEQRYLEEQRLKQQQNQFRQQQQSIASSVVSETISTSKVSSGPTTPNVKRVERTVVVNTTTNHQEALLEAIRIATQLDPSLEVEKVEITSEE